LKETKGIESEPFQNRKELFMEIKEKRGTDEAVPKFQRS
jgi:hypothetical protein